MQSQIKTGMTYEPVTITGDVSIAEAQDVMRSWGMRHLPVLEGSKLVGLISDRDILKAYALKKTAKTPVSEIMSRSPYQVSERTSVAEVARAMADNKYGCAIVTNPEDQVIGIFTTVDALNLLARLIHQPSEEDYRVIQMREYLRTMGRVS